MLSIEYEVSAGIFERFPGYCLGVLVFDGTDNLGDPAALAPALREAESLARASVRGNVAALPEVLAWRDAYRRFGAKPAEHRSSIEAMLRRVVKPDELPSINPLVDIGNIVSLKHRLPVGVHPLRGDDNPVRLRLAAAGDRFLEAPDQAAQNVPAGEVVLASGADVLTRRWTWRQSVLTRTLPQTRRVFFNVDGLPPITHTQIEAAMADVVSLVARHCGGALLGQAVLAAGSPRLGITIG